MSKQHTLFSGWFMWALIFLVCIFAGFELYVRYTIGTPRSERFPLLRVTPDPQLGYRPLSGDVHYGYEHLVKLNSLGLRGPEIPIKQADEVRILLLGETQAYGLGIADHELVTYVLEQTLNESLDATCFRAINLGVRAYGLNQQLILLENTGLDLFPDHVVVLFYVYSFGRFDINSYYERVRDRDWYMLDLKSKPNAILRLKWRFVQLARKSALFAWAYYNYKQRRDRAGLIGVLMSGDTPIPASLIDYLREQLIRLKDLASKHRFQVSLAVLPLPQQLVRDYPNEQYQSLLRQISSQQDIELLDLWPSLENLYKQTGRLPVAPFDDHYDAAAHKTIGIELAQRIREQYPSTKPKCLKSKS